MTGCIAVVFLFALFVLSEVFFFFFFSDRAEACAVQAHA